MKRKKEHKKRTKRWLIRSLIVGVSLIVSVFFVRVASAKGFWDIGTGATEEIQKILNRYDEYLTQANMLLSSLRWLGWGIIWLLQQGVELFNGVTLELLNLGDFFSDSSFTGILGTFDSVKGFLLLLSLLLIFSMMLFGKKVEVSQAFTNLMLSMVIVMALPTFVSSMLDVTTDVSKGLSADTNGIGIGKKTILNNTSDLTVFAANDWSDPTKIKDKSGINDPKYVQINQQITEPDKFGGEGVLGYRLDMEDGKEVAAEFDPDVGFGKRWAQDLVGDGYYRWHVNFITVIVTLLALNAAYILAGVRMGRMMIELAFNQGFATVLAFADFRTMTRLKQVLLNIVGILCAIVAIFATFAVFSSFVTYIVEKDVSGVAYLFALIGAIWFVLDGPVMIQKVLGVDAGMSSAWGAVGGMMGMKALADGAGKVKDIAKAGLGMAAKGAAFAGGAVAGMASKATGSAESAATQGLNSLSDAVGNAQKETSGASNDNEGLNAKDSQDEDNEETSDDSKTTDGKEDKDGLNSQEPEGDNDGLNSQESESENDGLNSQEPEGDNDGLNSQEPEGENDGLNSQEPEGNNDGLNSQEPEGDNDGLNSQEPEGENDGLNSQETEGKNEDVPSESKEQPHGEKAGQTPSQNGADDDASLYSAMPPQDESLYDSEPPQPADGLNAPPKNESSTLNKTQSPQPPTPRGENKAQPMGESSTTPSHTNVPEGTNHQPQSTPVMPEAPQQTNAFKEMAVNKVKGTKLAQSAMKGYQMGKGTTKPPTKK